MPTEPTSQAERFEALWVAHHPRVFCYALRRLGDRDAAEDVCSETFLVAWRRRESVPRQPRPWLLGVARKVLANYVRTERRQEALFAQITAHDPPPLFVPGADDHASDLVEAFNALAPADREILSLIVWEELKPREAARVLGIDAPRLSVRLHRAKNRLRRNLAEREAAGIDTADENTESEQASLSEMRMEGT